MRFSIDDVLVDAMVDMAEFDLPLATIFPQVDPAALAPFRWWLEPLHYTSSTTTLHLACHSLVLRFGARVILIDTCVGCDKPRPVRPNWDRRTDSSYLANLATLGVSPNQVDTVLCTHLHADHVGWNTRHDNGRWVPTFPNARYLIGRAEMEHWEFRGRMEGFEALNHGAHADSVLPVVAAGLVDLVDDGYELADGLALRILAGHTPGQMGVFLDRGAARAVFCGDAIHSPVQIARPDWSTAFCADPAASAATRRGLLEEASESGRIIVPAHFKGVGRSRIERRGGAFAPVFPDQASQLA